MTGERERIEMGWGRPEPRRVVVWHSSDSDVSVPANRRTHGYQAALLDKNNETETIIITLALRALGSLGREERSEVDWAQVKKSPLRGVDARHRSNAGTNEERIR